MIGNYYDRAVASVDLPQPTKKGGGSFWRTEPPVIELDKKTNTRRVVRGGLFDPQREWWESKAFVKLFVGGYGAGKTLALCKRMISLALANAPCPVAIVSPTFPLARHTTVSTIMSLLEGKQSLLGRAFAWRYNTTNHEFRIRYHGRQALIIIYSGEYPDRLKGPNLAAAGLDEPFIQDESVFTQMIARVRHPNAVRKEINLSGCVRPDTLVATANGVVSIGSLKPNNRRDDAGEFSRFSEPVSLLGLENEYHDAIKFFNNGRAKTRKITCELGYKIEATCRHPLWAMSSKGVGEWRRADELKVGDYLAVGRIGYEWPGKDPLEGFKLANSCKGSKLIPKAFRMKKSYAYLLGVHMSGRSKNLVPELFKNYKAQLSEVFTHLGIVEAKASKKVLPDWVFALTKTNACAFLAGLIDGGGTVCEIDRIVRFHTPSKRLAKQVQTLMLLLGSPAKLSKVSSERWTVSTTGSASINLCKLLSKHLKNSVKRASAQRCAYETLYIDTDKVPFQGSAVIRAFGDRKNLNWEKCPHDTRFLIESIKQIGGDSVSFTNLKRFLENWDYAEGWKHPEVESIRKHVENFYSWQPVTKITNSECDTVDFVVPATNSYWANGFISHNTPEQLNWGYELAHGTWKQRLDVKVVTASTRKNLALQNDYIKNLEATFDGKSGLAFISGHFVNLTEGAVYHAFDPSVNSVTLDIPEGVEFGAGMDFNVDPMSASIFWKSGEHMHFFAEVSVRNSDTQDLCAFLRNKFGDRLRTIFPDASGSARKTAAPGGKTDFYYIREAGYEIDAPYANPKRRDRYNSVNGKLKSSNGKTTLTVCPKGCPNLTKYLRVYSHELMNKQKHMSHALDSFGYPVHRLFPIVREGFDTSRFVGH